MGLVRKFLGIPSVRDRDIFVDFHMSGLCNRLRGLNSLRAFAELWDRKLLFRWTAGWACPCKYLDIFKPLSDVEMTTQVPASGGYNFVAVKGHKSLKAGASPEEWFAAWGRGIDRKVFYDLYAKKVQSLELQDTIQSKLDTFCLEQGVARRVGLHIRRTDFAANSKKLHGYETDNELVIARIGREIAQDPSSQFLLATDCPVTEELFLSQYPKHIVAFPKTFSREKERGIGWAEDEVRLTSVEDAVIDLYALSRCRTIIGTGESSFSAYAGVLAGIDVEMLRD